MESIIKIFNFAIAIIFFVCYSYQFAYILIAFIRKRREPKAARLCRYAVLISARNEQAVLGNLLKSIRDQDYNGEITVFVVADNCKDKTAEIAREQGAVVYERFNTELVGKGYALDFLLQKIYSDYPKGFDGYFVFDADNVLEPSYVTEMNKLFSAGNNIVTSYRNSKNYGDNWISAGYALWFLRESQFLNRARYALGTSCAVSGTGFLVSQDVLRECGGWKFFLLTEDIEFSVDGIIKGHKIAYCEKARLYDEQPTSFKQSVRQRMRWARGYLQVFGKHGKGLFKGILKGSFSCFDMLMNIMPALILSILALIVNTVFALINVGNVSALWQIGISLIITLGNAYGTLFIIGLITTVTEWKSIHTSSVKKVLYTFTFPLFMFTYVPISAAAFFKKVEWKPIEHTRSKSLEEIKSAK